MGELESLGPGSVSAFLKESLEDWRVYEGATPAVVGDAGSFSESRLRIAAKFVVDPPDGLLLGGA